MRYKYRLENFVLFDCVGLERHLAEMAAKGLQLESIGRLVWKYRVTEPKKLTYSVTYAPARPFMTRSQRKNSSY